VAVASGTAVDHTDADAAPAPGHLAASRGGAPSGVGASPAISRHSSAHRLSRAPSHAHPPQAQRKKAQTLLPRHRSLVMLLYDRRLLVFTLNWPRPAVAALSARA
jgi:hypothetical protein